MPYDLRQPDPAAGADYRATRARRFPGEEVSAPSSTDVLVFPPTGQESELRREIDGIAKLIGADVDDQTADYGHYTASRDFGPVEYRAVAIPARSREYHDAQRSYTPNVIPDTGEEV